MQYGPSINKKGTINLVEGTGWNEFIELNRMAFDDYLPKYSESRCIAISIRLIKKNAPETDPIKVKIITSFPPLNFIPATSISDILTSNHFFHIQGTTN